jgi:bleomycin hydrolase
MRAIVRVALLLCLVPVRALAQGGGGITPQALAEMEKACPVDAHFKAVQHALAQEDSQKLAVSWEKELAVDAHFSNTLDDQPITDQKSSGRCWMFSALNVFRRPAARKLNAEDVEFSQNYLFFYDKLEKANVFLEAVIRSRSRPYTDRTVEWLMQNTVQDGGNWLGFIELVKKYGVVPKETMPETWASSNSRGVNRALSMRLKVAAARIRAAAAPDALAPIKQQALQDVYRILALNFGVPPKEFQWRYRTKDKKLTALKTYTPQEYYEEVVGEPLDDYLALYSIPTLPFGRKYEIELDKAVEDRPNMFFVNTPLEQVKDIARAALLDGQPVWFGSDVSQETYRDEGLMMPGVFDYASMYGMDFSLTRKELFETYSASPNHNMVFTGIDVADGRVVKWRVENSWGEKAGKKGYFIMLDDWFDRYVQVIVVNTKFIPPALLEVFSTKAQVLPPWDPMVTALRYE